MAIAKQLFDIISIYHVNLNIIVFIWNVMNFTYIEDFFVKCEFYATVIAVLFIMSP